MRVTALLSVPVAAVVVALGAASPAAAGPPEVQRGYFVVDLSSFTLTQGDTTGAVSRFTFSLTATSFGDLPGSFTETQHCRQIGNIARCHGTATSVGADGSTGTISSRITCTMPEFACEGRANGRGTGPDGERLVWHTIVSPGPGVGLYETRVVRGPSV